MTLRPVLVLALDGASFDVIRPLAEAGRLPHLAAWMKAGRAAALPSTAPPVTFPAWSSFMTGLSPGEHGIFDFTQKLPGEYRLRFVNATDRPAPTLFRRVCDAGGRVLVLGLPATHPPEPVDGLLVCGFEAPVASGTDPKSASDPDLYRRIAAKAGPWMRPELDESAKADDFHERAATTLLTRIDRKRDFALEALAQLRSETDGALPELIVIVFSESDTAGHHAWRDHDPRSPRHDPNVSTARKDALASVYQRLDAACGALREAVGDDAACIVLSDHGMGSASDKVVHLNRFLAQAGLLSRRTSAFGVRGVRDQLARRLRDTALAWLPPRVAQLVFRRARGAAARLESNVRFSGFDWQRTLAFSEEANTQPGIWINLVGREAEGCVAPEDYEAVRDRVIAALAEWKLPSGAPVVARALRREAVYSGPYVARAPDLVLELAPDAGHGLSLVPTPWAEGGPQGEGIPCVRVLAPSGYEGGRGRGMNGTHRGDGIFIACNPELAAVEPPTRLAEVAPWLARVMGLAWAADGAATNALPAREVLAYGEEEEAMVAERLRALGYLE